MPDQVALLTIPLRAGDRLALQVAGSTFGASSSTARLSVQRPDGTAFVSPTYFGNSGVWIDPISVSETGTYTVLVDPQGAAVGVASVTLHAVPVDVAVAGVVGGDPVEVLVGTPGQNGSVVFHGVAGQRVAVSLAGSTFGSSTSTVVGITKADGSTLASAGLVGATGFIDAITLPADGDYKVVVNPYLMTTGKVSVSLLDASAPPVVGAADGSVFEVATSVPGQNGALSFNAVAGQRVAIEVVDSTYGASTSSVKLSITGPSGAAVGSSSGAAKGTFIEPVVLATGGEYRVVVDPTGVLVGAIKLRVHAVPVDVAVAGVVGGDPVEVLVGTPGQNGSVVFHGVAGQRVAVSLAGSTFGSSTSTVVGITKADGSTLASAGLVGATGFIDAITLPADGDYKVVVNPYLMTTGKVAVEIVDTGVEVSYRLSPEGDEIAATTVSPGKNIRLETELRAGIKYGFHIDGSNGRAAVVVRGPSGSTVVTDNSSSLDRTIVFIAPVDGAYSISIDPPGGIVGTWNCALFIGASVPRIALPPSTNGWYQTDSIAVDWTAASSVKIAGCAVVLDAAPYTEPTEVTTATPSTTILAPEGVRWLHVRCILADGTMSGTAHARIQVDTVAPALEAPVSPSHPDSDALYGSRRVELAWAEPEDDSGVAGYSLESSKSPSGSPDESIDTIDLHHEFDLDSNGLWYLRVRPVDVAGNVGDVVSYQVNVDSDAPAQPLVTSTHQGDAGTSQRTLVAQFSPGDQDVVTRWAALVDHDPGTIPDAGLGKAEPRLAATLEPGVWWLHVAAGDDLGRWSAPAHVKVVVTAGENQVLEPANSWQWARTTIAVACQGDPTGLRLATLDRDGGVEPVGPVVRVDGGCAATWDPELTRAESGRIWPDGAYELVTIDNEGERLSEPVPVFVRVQSNIVDRMISDYRAGKIGADALAELIVAALQDPLDVPLRYSEGAVSGGMTTELLLQAMEPLDPEARLAIFERLNSGEPSRRKGDMSSGGAFTLESFQEPTPHCASRWPLSPLCSVSFPDFYITYTPGAVGDPGSLDEIPAAVQTTYDALESAKAAYRQMGFRTPTQTIRVELTDDVTMRPNSGISLPLGLIRMDITGGAGDYLPMHEYFHQVQYQYFSLQDLHSQPYWWMEATAEWAAHRAQEIRPEAEVLDGNDDLYASNIDRFLSSTSALHVAQKALLPENPLYSDADDREYGAFVLAEYLEERYGGDEAIRWIWDRVGDGLYGILPLDAVDDYVQSQGSTYSEMIEGFRLSNYVLSNQGDIGYTDDDAQDDRVWRQLLQSSVPNGLKYRRVTAAAMVGPSRPTTSGEGRIAESNSAYIEIQKPPGVQGSVTVVVWKKSHPRDTPNVSNVRASVIPVANYPELCGRPGGLSPALASDSGSVLASGSPDPRSVLAGSFEVASGCSTLTIVVTNTAKDASPLEFGWSLVFSATSAVLSNGAIELGVTRGGSLIADGVGLRRKGSADSDVLTSGCDCAAWGVSDGGVSAWVNSNAGGPVGEELQIQSFASDGVTATSRASLGSTLDVGLVYRPSEVSSVYAIDVSIRRTSESTRSGRVLFDMALDFDVPPTPFHERITWDSTTGKLPKFVRSVGRDGFHGGDPLGEPAEIGGPVVLGETSALTDQGVVIVLDIGELAVGESATFTIYVGMTYTMSGALSSLDEVGAEIFAIAEPEGGADVEGGYAALFGVSNVSRLPTLPDPE